jgi:hypothetical protein
MTPVVMADRLLASAFSTPGELGPNGAPGEDQAEIFLASGQEGSRRFVVAQASPGGAAVAASTVDGPAVEVGSASRSNRNGQSGAIGESVLKYMGALHENGRSSRERAPAAAEPAVRLVVAREPGPAAAALAPPGQPSPQLGEDDGFEANLAALKQFQNYSISVNLAANVVSTATGAIKTLTERMG